MSLLNYIEPLNSNLVCCICRAPFTNPRTTRTCMHTFCHDCIIEAVKHSPQCPVDRSPLAAMDLLPANPIVKHLVDELLVECPHRVSGCMHICQRQLLESHLTHRCMYVRIPCPGSNCDQRIMREEYERCANVCIHRPRQCHDCGVAIKCGDLSEHYSECSAKVATCPWCAAEFAKAEMQQHVGSCPDAEIPCAHVDNGCLWTGPRHQLSAHIQICAYDNIKGFFTIASAKMAALTTENATLQMKVHTLEGLVHAMQQEIQIMKSTLAPWYGFETQRFDRTLPIQMPASVNDNYRTPVDPSTSHDLTTRASATLVSNPTDTAFLPAHPADVNDTAAYFSTPPVPRHHEVYPRIPTSHFSNGTLDAPPPQHLLSFPVAPLNLSSSLQDTLSGLRDSVVATSTSVASLARRNDLALTSESMRINEELGSLRYAIHGVRLQLHRLMMDRNAQALGRPGESFSSSGPISGSVLTVPTSPLPPAPIKEPSFTASPGTKL